MAFESRQVMPGVYHIKDAMGVCMTLLVGQEKALLVDTGYGAEDVHAFVRTLTDLPLQLLLTHGHHDHAMGAMWFDNCLLFAEDLEDFAEYTGDFTRKRVLNQAKGKGVPVEEEKYLAAQMPTPQLLAEGEIDLGGLAAQVMLVPAHTQGSAMIYVKEHNLLLSGDNWNPTTWAWFPRSLDVHSFLKNVREVAKLPYTHVLCSHQFDLYDRSVMDDFLASAEDAIAEAEPSDCGKWMGINTYTAHLPHDQVFVFDWDKAQKKG